MNKVFAVLQSAYILLGITGNQRPSMIYEILRLDLAGLANREFFFSLHLSQSNTQAYQILKAYHKENEKELNPVYSHLLDQLQVEMGKEYTGLETFSLEEIKHELKQIMSE